MPSQQERGGSSSISRAFFRPYTVQMMNHQRQGLALFLDLCPLHQFGQRLLGAGPDLEA